MVSKTNSAFAYITSNKFTCIPVKISFLTKFIKFFCDSVLAISKSLFDVIVLVSCRKLRREAFKIVLVNYHELIWSKILELPYGICRVLLVNCVL